MSVLPQVVQVAQKLPRDEVAFLGAALIATASYLSRGILWDKPDPYHSTWFERPQEADSVRNQQKETRDIATKLEEARKDIVVFFGSQSGTAETFAHRLARELSSRFGVGALSADLSDYDAATIASLPRSKTAIFLLSTFGEGDPSDNTAGLWDWINNSTSLSVPALQYAAFGLGNSNYKYYNKVVDVVSTALSHAGAHLLIPVCRGDDANGETEEDFMVFKDRLFAKLVDSFDYQEQEQVYEASLKVVEDESLTPIDLHQGEPISRHQQSHRSNQESAVCALQVTASRSLFETADRTCLHNEIDISTHPELRYKTGDHLAVWPSNPDDEVDGLIRILGLHERKDIPISITAIDSSTTFHVPTPTTVEVLCRHYLEICATVSRDTISALAQFAPTSEAKGFLKTLGNSKTAHAQYVQRHHITIGRLLQNAGNGITWSSIPVSFLIENVAPLKPRYYSISSSSIVQPRTLAITASINMDAATTTTTVLQPATITPTVQHVPGLTTNYLLSLKAKHFSRSSNRCDRSSIAYHLDGPDNALVGGKVYAQIRRSKFKMPVLASHPMIMVAAGTGIAPFRGFLQERVRLKSMGKDVGRMILFFGCRNGPEDFLYREELENMVTDFEGKLEIVTAFSRESNGKVYVQDRIRQRIEDVAGMIQDASFYVCGSASMAREVAKVVGEGMAQKHDWTDATLKEWSARAKRTHRWQEDVW